MALFFYFVLICSSQNLVKVEAGDILPILQLFKDCHVDLTFFSDDESNTVFEHPLILSTKRTSREHSIDVYSLKFGCIALVFVNPHLIPNQNSTHPSPESVKKRLSHISGMQQKYSKDKYLFSGGNKRLVDFYIQSRDTLVVPVFTNYVEKVDLTKLRVSRKRALKVPSRLTPEFLLRSGYGSDSEKLLAVVSCWKSSGAWKLNLVHYHSDSKIIRTADLEINPATNMDEIYKLNMDAFIAFYRHESMGVYVPPVDFFSFRQERRLDPSPIRRIIKGTKAEIEIGVTELILSYLMRRFNNSRRRFSFLDAVQSEAVKLTLGNGHLLPKDTGIGALIRMEPGYFTGVKAGGRMTSILFLTCDARESYLSFKYFLEPYDLLAWIAAILILLLISLFIKASLRHKMKAGTLLMLCSMLLEQGVEVDSKIRKFPWLLWILCPFLLMSIVLTNGYKGIVITGTD